MILRRGIREGHRVRLVFRLPLVGDGYTLVGTVVDVHGSTVRVRLGKDREPRVSVRSGQMSQVYPDEYRPPVLTFRDGMQRLEDGSTGGWTIAAQSQGATQKYESYVLQQ